MNYLMPYLKRYRLESVLAPLFKMLEAAFDLLVPLVTAQVINQAIPAGDRGAVIRAFALLTAMALLGLGCSFTAQYFAAKAATATAAGLRRQLLAHIQSLSFTELDRLGSATLITRMTGDVNQVQNGLNMFLRLFLRSPFIVAGATLLAFAIDARLALIFLGVIAALLVIVFGVMARSAPLYRQVQRRLDQVTAATLEDLSGVRVIRAFGREESQQAAFRQADGALLSTQLKVGRVASLMNPLTYAVVNMGVIALLWLGGRTVEGGLLASGDIVALVNYINQILVELVKLANMVILLGKALASLGRVEQVLGTPSSMDFSGQVREGEVGEELLRFDNVGLHYQGAGGEALTGFSFTVRRGETVGIIGGTGSGKTSLVNLIPRFYDATSGEITLKGKPIRAWEEGALRKLVAVVPQKAQLFTGTIRSNLLWGRPEATDQELWAALEAAQAASFVRQKPGGLDEPVEQGGRNFSGGQRQRLTIARALAAGAEILILDDASSALDYATDAALRRALAALPGVTLFLVSQRTSSIQHAGQILVLEDGHLAGRGTHGELLETCPVYREIYESQFRKEGA